MEHISGHYAGVQDMDMAFRYPDRDNRINGIYYTHSNGFFHPMIFFSKLTQELVWYLFFITRD